MWRSHLDRRKVAGHETIRRAGNRHHRLAFEQIEAFLERVDVRIDRATWGELVHAQAGVHRAGRPVDELGHAIAARMAVVHRVHGERTVVEGAEEVHAVRDLSPSSSSPARRPRASVADTPARRHGGRSSRLIRLGRGDNNRRLGQDR
jgi:hypothetical protein